MTKLCQWTSIGLIDDGIKYSMEMFDNSDLVEAIGNYIKTNFDTGIMNTIHWLSEDNTSV